jgi:hypothetical protein
MNLTTFRSAMSAFLLVSLTSGLIASEWHVAPPPLGDDSNPGTNELPFATIQGGIDAASDGDTVIVGEGTYLENIQFNGENIILRSTDPLDPSVVADTIVDGSKSGSVVTFSGTETEACVLAGFTIQNGKVDFGAGISGSEPAGHNPTHATIQNNIITRNVARWDGGGLFCCNGTIQHNVITNNSSAYGGGLAYCDGVIQNNIVTNNSATPWYGCGGGLYNCNGTIQNNTILDNSADHGGGGLYECYGSIYNCIIRGNRASDCGNQLSTSNSPSFSCIEDWTEGGRGNIKEVPLFVDAPGGDYHLQAGSPCIDSGANGYWLAWPLRDLDGNCRLAGRSVDMGCYEYGASRDSDGDLLSDSDELRIGIDLYRDDTDSDGLRDGLEVLRGSDPLKATPPRAVHVRPEISTIQESLGIAVDGDEIVVAPGIYIENLCFFGFNVTLRSSDPKNPYIVASTILDGGGSGPVVSFTGNEGKECVLAGFTLRRGCAFRGGGISGNGAQVAIQNNIITGNSATGRYAYGGGLYRCDGTIQNNKIFGNWAHGCGGGLFSCGGLVQNNTISGNWASNYGGGLYRCDGTIQNNVVASNWTYDCAGGLGWCKGRILNNTIIGNWTDNNSNNLGWCDGVIQNNIVWGNTETDFLASSTPSFSCIQGWSRGGEGNTADDPRFVDRDGPDNNPETYEDNDYHLRPDSPCIDAGTHEAVAPPNTDIDGEWRPFGPEIDIGADEYVDGDRDHLPDYWEILHFGMLWLGREDDPDADGLPNAQEFLRTTNPNNPDTDADGQGDGREVLAGTDPADSQSVFRIVEIACTPWGTAFRWSAVPMRTYRCFFSSGLESWQPLGGIVTAAPSDLFLSVFDWDAAPLTRRFYRVEVAP